MGGIEGTRRSALQAGKLPPELLDEFLRSYEIADERVVLGPRTGEDAAVIDFGDRYLVAKSDPITFATEEIGWYAVHINANDVAAMGASPRWFLATVLLPERGTDRRQVRALFDQMTEACLSIGANLVGGHTEVTLGLPRTVIAGHMLGEVDKDRLVLTGGAQVGDALLLTKGIAIEGTAIAARELGRDLRDRGYSEEFLARARAFLREPGLSILADARVATESGEVHAMHDPTEGGLATGLHEMAAASEKGLVVDMEAIPVFEECKAICDEFGLDPLGMIASGALLVAAPPQDAGPIEAALESKGIECARIGTVEPPERGVVLRTAAGERPLPRYDQDELARIL